MSEPRSSEVSTTGIPAAPLGPAEPSPTFDDFFGDHYEAVVRLVVPLTRSRPLAEDVAQESFAAALDRWPRVRRYDRPDLWVRRVALNRAISAGRRRGAEQRALARLRATGAARLAVVADGPDLGTADPHGDHELWAAVRALPGRQAQLVSLVYVDDQSIDAAARVLGLSPSTARTHLQRARARLAEVLATRPEATDPERSH